MIFEEKRKIKSGAKILVQFQKYSFIAKNGRYFFFLKTGMEESLEIIIDRSKFQKKKEDGRTNKGICFSLLQVFCFYTTPKNIFVLQYGDLTEKKDKKTKMEICKFFLESFFFQGGMFCFFFKGGGSNLLYIFFLFWKW